MRASHASLAILGGLAAVVTADSLPPESIPIQCATICGPIIELTAKCDVHGRRKMRREVVELDRREWVPKLAVEPKVVGVGARHVHGEEHRYHMRNFHIIRPGLTTGSASAIQSANLGSTAILQPTTAITRINPIIIIPPSATLPEQVVPTSGLLIPPSSGAGNTTPILETSTSTSSTFALSSSAASTRLSATTTVTLGSGGGTNTLSSSPVEVTNGNAQKGTDNGVPTNLHDGSGEEQCVCLNESFDVAMVAALCSSCVAQSGESINNAEVIVQTCNFAPQEYNPNKDTVVNNVRVQATKPAAVWEEGNSVKNGAAPPGVTPTPFAGVIVGTVSFFLGAALLL